MYVALVNGKSVVTLVLIGCNTVCGITNKFYEIFIIVIIVSMFF